MLQRVWLACALLLAVLASPAGAQDEGGLGLREDINKTMDQMRQGPKNAPRVNRTGFDAALRCMDGLFQTFGVQNATVLVDDIPDTTRKVAAGGREMFISATSQMTRRSRAVRLVPYAAGPIFGGGVMPPNANIIGSVDFAVQGSISQFDESMIKRQRDGGVCLGPLCIGAAGSDSLSAMALDLSILRREDGTLVNGVTSRNQVLVVRRGTGADGEVNMSKFGINFNFTISRSDGQGQALRALVELGSIELYGRLFKLPYWSCTGATLTDADVAREITLETEDWWENLRGDVPSLVSWLQVQMKTRKLYKGDIDGNLSEALKQAVRAYRVAMGQPDDLKLDADFFRAYLAANHAELEPRAGDALKAIVAREGDAAATVAGSAQGAGAQGAAAPPAGPAVLVQSARGAQHVHRPGELVHLQVQVNRDAYLYCYFFDEAREVTQLYPALAKQGPLVRAGTSLDFGQVLNVQMAASNKGLTESVACYLSPRDLGSRAPRERVKARDAASLAQLLKQLAGSDLEMGVFDVKVR